MAKADEVITIEPVDLKPCEDLPADKHKVRCSFCPSNNSITPVLYGCSHQQVAFRTETQCRYTKPCSSTDWKNCPLNPANQVTEVDKET